MLKQVKIGFMALLAVAFLASCQSANNDARDAARTAVEQQAPVQPANTSQAQPATQAEPAVPAGPTTEMTFAETTFDFGTITEGEKVAHTYAFTNTGSHQVSPLAPVWWRPRAFPRHLVSALCLATSLRASTAVTVWRWWDQMVRARRLS